MLRTMNCRRFVWLGMGLLAGLIFCGFWPQTPLHTVATDRSDTFAVATGFVDDGVEAVCFLDFLTGNLNAVVLARQGGGFSAMYAYPGAQLQKDLGIDPAKKPKYMLLTGMVDLRRGVGGAQMGTSAIYVAEVTTGRLAAYGIPWSPTAYSSGRAVGPLPLTLLGVTQFRRNTATGAAVPP